MIGRFLTGYVVSFNRSHKRHGHLFRNRYRSIVCDEDTYFKELARYIHVNPGKVAYEWQDATQVLKWFGGNPKEARRKHHAFVSDGIAQGRRPELVGGRIDEAARKF